MPFYWYLAYLELTNDYKRLYLLQLTYRTTLLANLTALSPAFAFAVDISASQQCFKRNPFCNPIVL